VKKGKCFFEKILMPDLLIVGGGLFGSLAASYARRKGLQAHVFDANLHGAASPAAAGLFKKQWAGKKFQGYFERGLSLLELLYEVRTVTLELPEGIRESLLHIPPRLILEPTPKRMQVTAIGDGWLEADGQRYQGWVYIAAGVWCRQFLGSLEVQGKAGTALAFNGEHSGRMQPIARGRQALAFVRDPGRTYFSDGTAEVAYTADHERQTRQRAFALGLTAEPVQRWHGFRPYSPGGPVFQKMSPRTWLATGGRKMGTILGAALARRLVEEELGK
jgi:glycine/D-amino acid oxidase-like deaminating enzyme